LAERKRSFAVIGLGAFGSTVATELARFGGYVLGIDIDEKRVAHLADDLAEAKILDGSDEAALREAGLDRYGVVVIAIGEDVESSILCTMNARMLGCSTVWVKARDRTHHRILTKLGADRVILPEQEIGQHVAQMLNNPAVWDYVRIGNGFFAVDLVVPAKLDGRTLASLKLEGFELRPLGLMRGTEFHAGDASDLVLKEGDNLLILGQRAELRRFGDTL
jgi:trk system potassium uptake protein TrkA